ncbi:MAG: hypothetical protein ACQEQ4_10080 [Fibrobacterota bacterium]
MESVFYFLWLFTIFVFSLILFFVWGKLLIISKKLHRIAARLDDIDAIRQEAGDLDSLPV